MCRRNPLWSTEIVAVLSRLLSNFMETGSVTLMVLCVSISPILRVAVTLIVNGFSSATFLLLCVFVDDSVGGEGVEAAAVRATVALLALDPVTMRTNGYEVDDVLGGAANAFRIHDNLQKDGKGCLLFGMPVSVGDEFRAWSLSASVRVLMWAAHCGEDV